MQEHICTLPMLWQVKELPEKNSVFVRAEFVELCLQQDDALPFITRLRQRKFGNCTYVMSTGEIYDYQNYQTPPTEVVKVAAEMMQVSLEKIYGRLPTFTDEDLQQEDFLEAFCFQPYEPQCYSLKWWIEFWDLIPRDSQNVYERICKIWQITPPDGLKEIYRRLPHALPMYRILTELGFKDFSIMGKFFEIGKIGSLEKNVLAGMPVLQSELHYESEEKAEALLEEHVDVNNGDMITQEEIDALLMGEEWAEPTNNRKGNFAFDHIEWRYLKSLVTWMIGNRGEEITAKHLINRSNMKPSLWLDDLSRIIRENLNDLPMNVQDMILDNGWTREVYEMIIKEYLVPKYVTQGRT